jgi:hypothetical protein
MPAPSRRPSLAPVTQPSPRPIVVKSAEIDRIPSDGAPSAPVMAAPPLDSTVELLMDIDAIERRYPLLRNAM